MCDTLSAYYMCDTHGVTYVINDCALYARTNKKIATTKAPKRRARFQKQASTTLFFISFFLFYEIYAGFLAETAPYF